jgi:hypothetical protein
MFKCLARKFSAYLFEVYMKRYMEEKNVESVALLKNEDGFEVIPCKYFLVYLHFLHIILF